VANPSSPNKAIKEGVIAIVALTLLSRHQKWHLESFKTPLADSGKLKKPHMYYINKHIQQTIRQYLDTTTCNYRAGTRKVKPIWILLKQETVSGSSIS